jgi:threonine-phosphate decarboxylase
MIAFGIMIRKASSFEGLDNSYIRIAIKGYEDNKYLLECFNKYDKYCVDNTNISR